MHEALASRVLVYSFINGENNPAIILSKHWVTLQYGIWFMRFYVYCRQYYWLSKKFGLHTSECLQFKTKRSLHDKE